MSGVWARPCAPGHADKPIAAAQASAILGSERSLSLPDAIAGELVGNIRLDGLGGLDICRAAIGVPVALFGDTPAVERRRVLRIDPQRRVVIRDRLLEHAELQIDKAAAVERILVVGFDLQRFVAILYGMGQIADNGARPAAIVER